MCSLVFVVDFLFCSVRGSLLTKVLWTRIFAEQQQRERRRKSPGTASASPSRESHSSGAQRGPRPAAGRGGRNGRSPGGRSRREPTRKTGAGGSYRLRGKSESTHALVGNED